MKKIFTAIILLLAMCPPFAGSVMADNGENINYFYDFEDYTAEMGSGKGPDANWKNQRSDLNGAWGAYYDEEQGNCMKLMVRAEPSFTFSEMIDRGCLHISYKVKVVGEKLKMLSLLYDNTNGDANKISKDNYSKWVYYNYEFGKIHYYNSGAADSMAGWSRKASNLVMEPSEWHRLDLITTDMSKSDAKANYYFDGQLINTTPIYFADSKGFKTVTFRIETNGETYDDAEYILIDNVSIKRVFTNIDTSLSASIVGSDKVPLCDAEFDVSLSEGVDESLLTKDNITITNQASGEVIDNYEITDVK